jgi:hypothetical protein
VWLAFAMHALRWGSLAAVIAALYLVTDSRADYSFWGACLLPIALPSYILSRRPFPKRAARWTVAALLLMAWYPLGMPYFEYAGGKHFPAGLPVVKTLSRPLHSYCTARPPAGRIYSKYKQWCRHLLND